MKKIGWIAVLVSLLSLFNAKGTPTGVPVTLNVPANPIFTDTGVYLHTGDQVYIQAAGLWSNGTDLNNWDLSNFFGPTGNPSFPYPGAPGSFPIASVVCYQGTSTTTTPPGGVVTYVGNAVTYTATVDGELWVGINDDYAYGTVDDNAGSMTVSVTGPGQTPPTLCPPALIRWDPVPGGPAICQAVLKVLTIGVTSVKFYDNGTFLGNGVLQPDGTYQFSWSPAEGAHAVYATGFGCGSQQASTPIATFNVGDRTPIFDGWSVPPTVPVNCSAETVGIFAQNIQNGKLYDNGQVVATGQPHPGGIDFSWQPAAGMHVVYATGEDCSGNILQTTTVTVNVAPSVAWTPTTPDNPTTCSTVEYTVLAGFVSTVKFYDNGVLFGPSRTVSPGIWVADWQPSPGPHVITAVGTSCNGQSAQATPLNFSMSPTIQWSQLPPTTLCADCANCYPQIPLVVSAHGVSTVKYYDNATLIGTGNWQGFGDIWEFDWLPTPGFHSLTAEGIDCAGNTVSTAAQTILPDDLVAWWKGEGNAHDSVNGNDGSAPTMGYNSSEVGLGFAFDGEDEGDDYVSIPASSSLDVGTGDGFTIEGWINVAYVNPNGGAPIIEWDSEESDGLQLWVVSPDNRLYANVKDIYGSDHQIYEDVGSITLNQFKHVALTYDRASGIARLYVDGAEVKNVNFGDITAQTTYPVNIGARTMGGWGSRFNLGNIDELSLYSRALSADEIQKIFATSHSGKSASPAPVNMQVGPPTGMVAWWKGEGNANDLVNGNNGMSGTKMAYDTAKVGSGFSFDGLDFGNDYISIPPSPSLDVGTSGGFTIEGWVNVGYVHPNGGAPIIEWDSQNSDGLQLWVNSPDNRLYANIKDTLGNSHQIQEDSGTVTLNEFKHVALTYDKASGMARLYIDGNEVKNANLGSFTPQTTYPVNIGARTMGGWGSRFNQGIIDELSLYNRALSAVEIKDIFLTGDSGKCHFPIASPSVGPMTGWKGENNAFSLNRDYDGELINPKGYTLGKVGSAFNFGGVSNYVLVNKSPSLDIGSANNGFSIEGWIKPASVSASMPIAEYERVLGSKLSGDLGVQFWTSAGGGLSANVVDTSGGNHTFNNSSALLSAGVWSHVALVFDSSTGTGNLYVNGSIAKQQALGAPLTPQTSFDLVLGARTTFGSMIHPEETFNGQMDELSVYSRSLLSTEINDIYNAGSSGKSSLSFINDGTLMAWWKAEGDATDGSPYNNLNNGIYENAFNYSPGEVGNAFNFDQSTSFVLVNPGPNIGQSGSISIEGWIRLANISSAAPIVEYERNLYTSSSSDLGVQFWTSVGGGLSASIVDTLGVSHTFSSTTTPLKAGAWAHVGLVYDSQSEIGTLYVNGSAVGQQSLGSFTPQTTYQLVIGARTGFGGVYFPGMIDELFVYSSALTPSDMAAIYNAKGNGRF